MASSSSLFQPIRVGASELKHRIVHAPLTRFRANKDHVHGDLGVKYYAQRASTPGTLLITEATPIAAKAAGLNNVPGIWNEEQIAGWKKVTDAVHAKGSFIYVQLWAIGRAADTEILAKGGHDYVSSSATQLEGKDRAPRPLSVSEIQEYVDMFGKAASHAVNLAGFDGVEIHGANGFLLDQFLQDVVNKRTDAYGGSIENRARFPLDVVDKVVEAIGAERTAIRLSPWNRFQGMRMDDPRPTFSYFVNELRRRQPNLSYLHVTEPHDDDKDASNDFLREIWAPRPFISASGYTPTSGPAHADRTGDLVAYGRHFLSNPDLPERIRKGIPLNPFNADMFYVPEAAEGYVDYPFANEASA